MTSRLSASGLSYDSKSTGRASQDSHWTAGDAEGRLKPNEDSLQMMRKPNQITIGSPMNPNISSEIQVTLLPSHDDNRQSI